MTSKDGGDTLRGATRSDDMPASPFESLSFIDELSQPVEAQPEAVWEALLGVLHRTMTRGSSAAYARLIGSDPLEGGGACGRMSGGVDDVPAHLGHFGQWKVSRRQGV